MAEAEFDLKHLLEQDRLMVLDLLESSRKLILDIKAEHYWTVQALEAYGQLSSIGGNLSKLLEALKEHWGEKVRIFEREEAVKLWKTAYGLWRAIPAVQKRFMEQLGRRRRQRIMGVELEEAEELDPEVIERELQQLEELRQSITECMEQLAEMTDEVPEKLIPPPKVIKPQEDGEGAPQQAQAVAAQAAAPAQQPAYQDSAAQPAGSESAPPATGASSEEDVPL